MKVHPELVSPYEMLTLRQNFLVALADSPWSLSARPWTSYLLEGRTGTVATCEPTPELKKKLLELMGESLVDFVDPDVLMVIWPPDLKATRRAASSETHEAFLFLNEGLDIEDGGLFLWDLAHGEAKCGLPKLGTAMVADQDEIFYITPSSATSKDPRMFFRIMSKERVSKEE